MLGSKLLISRMISRDLKVGGEGESQVIHVDTHVHTLNFLTSRGDFIVKVTPLTTRPVV